MNPVFFTQEQLGISSGLLFTPKSCNLFLLLLCWSKYYCNWIDSSIILFLRNQQISFSCWCWCCRWCSIPAAKQKQKGNWVVSKWALLASECFGSSVLPN